MSDLLRCIIYGAAAVVVVLGVFSFCLCFFSARQSKAPSGDDKAQVELGQVNRIVGLLFKTKALNSTSLNGDLVSEGLNHQHGSIFTQQKKNIELNFYPTHTSSA